MSVNFSVNPFTFNRYYNSNIAANKKQVSFSGKGSDILFRQRTDTLQPPSQTLPLEGGGQGGGEKNSPELIAGVISNISPAMRGININSVTNDLNNFSDTINSYTYGKSSLINNPDGFRIYKKNGDIYLDGFRQPDKNIKDGICEELTYKSGKELEEKYGDKYIFFATKGNCLKYHNMFHYYITAVERTKENEKNIQNIIEKTKQITLLAAELFQSNNFDDDKLQNIEKEEENLNIIKKESLKNAILIDPSFNIVKKYSDDGSIDGYTQKSFFDFETMNPYKNSSYMFPEKIAKYGIHLPIGFAKDIAPDLNVSQDTLLFLYIADNEENGIETEICTIDEYGFPEKLELDKSHSLYKFINCT